MMTDEQVMRVLLDRLNWPVRLARWQTAREFAKLLESRQHLIAVKVYLEWLRSRKFEMEIVSGLAVLLCTETKSLPPGDEVKRSIRKPSILADFLFQKIYRKALGGWLRAHSGEAPALFAPEAYFEKYQGQVIPLSLHADFERLEQRGGLPFLQQWAFEWRKLMDATNSPYASFPYYFIDGADSRTGVSGSFSQAQCNVYRSAFLRTLSFAVQRWGMPRDLAVMVSCRCLPLNTGLESLQPTRRPNWLDDIPEKCCKPGARLEPLVRRILKPNIGAGGMRPVALQIPVSSNVVEYGELSIESLFVTTDYVQPPEPEEDHKHTMLWGLDDLISFTGPLDEQDADEFRFSGSHGSAIPVCLGAWPIYLGFWQGEYVHMGINMPAPYNFSSAPVVGFKRGRMTLSSDKKIVGCWSLWNDNWSSLHPPQGRTRCGGVAQMATDSLKNSAVGRGMDLAWKVHLKIWQRQTEYGELTMTTRSLFFRE
jgi:hypothetical protein